MGSREREEEFVNVADGMANVHGNSDNNAVHDVSVHPRGSRYSCPRHCAGVAVAIAFAFAFVVVVRQDARLGSDADRMQKDGAATARLLSAKAAAVLSEGCRRANSHFAVGQVEADNMEHLRGKMRRKEGNGEFLAKDAEKVRHKEGRVLAVGHRETARVQETAVVVECRRV